MTDQERFSSLKNLKTYKDRRRAHEIFDELNIPKGTLEFRLEVLECRYPAST